MEPTHLRGRWVGGVPYIYIYFIYTCMYIYTSMMYMHINVYIVYKYICAHIYILTNIYLQVSTTHAPPGYKVPYARDRIHIHNQVCSVVYLHV